MNLFGIAIVLLTDHLMVNKHLMMNVKYNSILGKVVEVYLDGTKVLQMNANGLEDRGVRVVAAEKNGSKTTRDCATRGQIEEIFRDML